MDPWMDKSIDEVRALIMTSLPESPTSEHSYIEDHVFMTQQHSTPKL
jgi:hypothetical protein